MVQSVSVLGKIEAIETSEQYIIIIIIVRGLGLNNGSTYFTF